MTARRCSFAMRLVHAARDRPRCQTTRKSQVALESDTFRTPVSAVRIPESIELSAGVKIHFMHHVVVRPAEYQEELIAVFVEVPKLLQETWRPGRGFDQVRKFIDHGN
jgi:hypothetical protein